MKRFYASNGAFDEAHRADFGTQLSEKTQNFLISFARIVSCHTGDVRYTKTRSCIDTDRPNRLKLIIESGCSIPSQNPFQTIQRVACRSGWIATPVCHQNTDTFIVGLEEPAIHFGDWKVWNAIFLRDPMIW